MPDDVTRNVDTEGGAAVDGSVNAGGDFVGRDQESHVCAQNHSVGVGRDVHGGVHIHQGTPPSPGTEAFEPPPNLEEALDRYREDLKRRFSTIQIFGQPEPVPLEGIFTHVRLLDEPTAFQRYDVRALQEAIAEDPNALRSILHSRTRKDVEVVKGTELVTRPDAHRLLILGKPGAGKTTFLQHLALEATQGALEKLPIFVTLREWREVSDYEGLLDFIARQFDICQFPNARPVVDYFLRHVDTLVLFDGLDEIPEEGDRRGQAIDALRDFARKYPRPQILITCRVAATDYTFRGFKYVELADFNEGQMHAFVRKWFRDEEELAKQFWQEYQRDDNEGLRELGQVPLLLALLCLGYAETLSFPRRRVDLYEEALDALLKKWDSSRRIRRDEIYQKLSLGRKHQMLSQLAAQYFQDGRYFFEQRDLAERITAYLCKLPPAAPEEDVDGEAVLKAIEAQHGVLVERARHVHAFAHLTFQEYYTAKYVVDNAAKDTLPRLMAHITEDRWREVFLLTASLLPDADPFFEHFLKSLEQLIQGDDKLIEPLTWAEQKVRNLKAPYNPVALRAYYLDHTLALDRALHRARDIDLDCDCDLAPNRHLHFDSYCARDHALHRALRRTRARDRVHDHFLHRALDLDLTLDCTLARALDLHRILALDLPRGIGISRSYARYYALDLDLTLDQARVLTRELRLGTLEYAFETLEIPTADVEPKTWLAFAKELQALMTEHRDIGHDWDLTAEQAHILERYLYATHLLVECLDVAYVTDREAIEDRLLRPPREDDHAE